MSVKKFGPGYNDKGSLYIGIDQSLTGFAVTVLDASGGYETRVLKSDVKLPMVDRLMEIEQWLYSGLLPLEHLIENIAIESPVRGSHAALISGQLFAVTLRALRHELVLKEGGAYPLQVAPTQLKKYIAGKGSGVQKNQILLHTFKRWGAEFTDDNAADSFGLAKIALGEATTKAQKEVLRQLAEKNPRGKPSP